MSYIRGGLDPDIIVHGDRGGEGTGAVQSFWLKADRNIRLMSNITDSDPRTRLSQWLAERQKTVANLSVEGIEKSIDDKSGPGSHKNPDSIDVWRQENRGSSDDLWNMLRAPALSGKGYGQAFMVGIQEYSRARNYKDSQCMITALAGHFDTQHRIVDHILSSKPQNDTSGNSTSPIDTDTQE